MVIVVGGLALIASGAALAVLPGGSVYIWAHRVHQLLTLVLTPVLAGHVLVATGVLPGYRGVWRAMHLGGRLPIETARRIWPGWTDRSLGPDQGKHAVSEGLTDSLSPAGERSR